MQFEWLTPSYVLFSFVADEVFRPTPDNPSRLSPPPLTPRILPCDVTQTQAIPDHGQHLVATRPVLEWIA